MAKFHGIAKPETNLSTRLSQVVHTYIKLDFTVHIYNDNDRQLKNRQIQAKREKKGI